MTDLSYGAAVLLGMVQGATEFLPISSSAHLAFVQRHLGLAPESPAILLFDGLMHIGTVASILVVFGRSIVRFLVRLKAELLPGWRGRRHALRIAGLAILATAVTGVIGLTLKDYFIEGFASPVRIGAGLIVTGTLLLFTARNLTGRMGWGRFTWWQAALIGVAQGAAIAPGISRSGSTIATAALLGWRRRWAAEFSFLIAIPAIVGATAVQFSDTSELFRGQAAALPWGAMIAGTVAAMLTGVAALWWLIAAVRRAKLHYFAYYCLTLGVLMMTGVF